MAKTCMMCDEEITPANPVRWCSDCGEEGCARCVVGEVEDARLCVNCADEPDEEEFDDDDTEELDLPDPDGDPGDESEPEDFDDDDSEDD